MSRHPYSVARMERSAMRDRRSRIALRSMRATISAIILACAAGTPMAQPAPPQQPQQKLTIGFVDIEGDPRYEPIKGFERLVLKTREHPFTGAQIGIDEAQALTRVLKTDFVLERITLKSAG